MSPKAIPFDTLAYAKRLIAAGFTEKQAEVQAEAMAELVNDNLATKRDLEELRLHLLHEMKQLENRMVIKLGTMLAASIAIIVTLVKVL